MLPLERDYSDYIERYVDALITLANIHEWNLDQLQEQIRSIRSDLLFVRLDRDTSDGTIPFSQAEVTLASIRSMVRSAAMSTAGVKVSRRQTPAIVKNFLNDDLRLGHTKRGSYIFTIAARLSDVRVRAGDDTSLFDNNVTPLPINGFSRRVMEKLAANVELAGTLVEEDRLHTAELAQTRSGIDYWFIEALDEIANVDGLRSVEFSFQWALAAGRPEFGTKALRIDHSAFPVLAEARERIGSAVAVRDSSHKHLVAAAPKPETLIGPVIALIRESLPGSEVESADVVILSPINGRDGLKQIHVRLSGRDHELAILAYRSQIPLTITGYPFYETKEWRLTGNVEIDTTASEFHAGKDLVE